MMSYDSYFETSINRDGAQYVARCDGEYCGHHETHSAARNAIKLHRVADSARKELDAISRRMFADGCYGVWRAVERGDALPSDIEAAFNRHHAVSMKFQKAIGRA